MLKYYYVYKLIHKETGEFYFGSRGSKYHPSMDKYMGSMCAWNPDKTKLIKTILKDDFKTRNEATLFEVELITKHINDKLNRNYHIPSNNFYTVGRINVKDKNGKTMSVMSNDPRYLSGELVGVVKGQVTVRNSEGETFNVFTNNPRYLSGEFKHVTAGTATIKDRNNNYFRVPKNDPRYLSGELTGITKNLVLVKDDNGKNLMISKIEYLNSNGEFIRHWKGKKHSEKTKRKISETKQKNKSGVGKKNSQYGTCWIYNKKLKESKKIKKEVINVWLNKGWFKGRKMKF